VRALLDLYQRIDATQVDAGLWTEAQYAQQWIRTAKGNDVAVNREAVLRRGANTDNYEVEVNDVSGG
jgi:enoyl-CoA hydratase